MINLYEYDTATKEECLEDLGYIFENIYDYSSYEALERKGIRLQNIAKRLQELQE